ncbi:hypothetical protein NEPTK9_000234 [Candidatus Neptunochlamydia vexilliferae]|uniref:Uncharacterized protein n=1 Tax=Candidatus Neptunichlamydia vexilliferae TaxID=1651774 RepID=A0ABS0AZH8_9BACT|nr:hypothetical protein [Candidatus Neptunochlamydia vexilliferae]
MREKKSPLNHEKVEQSLSLKKQSKLITLNVAPCYPFQDIICHKEHQNLFEKLLHEKQAK